MKAKSICLAILWYGLLLTSVMSPALAGSTGGSGKRSLRSLPMVVTHISRAIGNPSTSSGGTLRLPLPPVMSLESETG